MGLPFLSGHRQQTMYSDGKNITVGEHPLAPAAEDLINAIHSKDVGAVAKALEAAFEIADSQPHEEGSHE